MSFQRARWGLILVTRAHPGVGAQVGMRESKLSDCLVICGPFWLR